MSIEFLRNPENIKKIVSLEREFENKKIQDEIKSFLQEKGVKVDGKISFKKYFKIVDRGNISHFSAIKNLIKIYKENNFEIKEEEISLPLGYVTIMALEGDGGLGGNLFKKYEEFYNSLALEDRKFFAGKDEIAILRQSPNAKQQTIVEGVANALDAMSDEKIGEKGLGIKQALSFIQNGGYIEVITKKKDGETVLLKIDRNAKGEFQENILEVEIEDLEESGTEIKIFPDKKLTEEGIKKYLNEIAKKFNLTIDTEIYLNGELLNGYESITDINGEEVVMKDNGKKVDVKINEDIISIKDKGVGMNNETLSKMFLPRMGDKKMEIVAEKKVNIYFIDKGEEVGGINIARKREVLESSSLKTADKFLNLYNKDILIDSNFLRVPEARQSVFINEDFLNSFKMSIESILGGGLPFEDKIQILNSIDLYLDEFLGQKTGVKEKSGFDIKEYVKNVKEFAREKIKDFFESDEVVEFLRDKKILPNSKLLNSILNIDDENNILLSSDLYKINLEQINGIKKSKYFNKENIFEVDADVDFAIVKENRNYFINKKILEKYENSNEEFTRDVLEELLELAVNPIDTSYSSEKLPRRNKFEARKKDGTEKVEVKNIENIDEKIQELMGKKLEKVGEIDFEGIIENRIIKGVEYYPEIIKLEKVNENYVIFLDWMDKDNNEWEIGSVSVLDKNKKIKWEKDDTYLESFKKIDNDIFIVESGDNINILDHSLDLLKKINSTDMHVDDMKVININEKKQYIIQYKWGNKKTEFYKYENNEFLKIKEIDEIIDIDRNGNVIKKHSSGWYNEESEEFFHDLWIDQKNDWTIWHADVGASGRSTIEHNGKSMKISDEIFDGCKVIFTKDKLFLVDYDSYRVSIISDEVMDDAQNSDTPDMREINTRDYLGSRYEIENIEFENNIIILNCAGDGEYKSILFDEYLNFIDIIDGGEKEKYLLGYLNDHFTYPSEDLKVNEFKLSPISKELEVEIEESGVLEGLEYIVNLGIKVNIDILKFFIRDKVLNKKDSNLDLSDMLISRDNINKIKSFVEDLKYGENSGVYWENLANHWSEFIIANPELIKNDFDFGQFEFLVNLKDVEKDKILDWNLKSVIDEYEEIGLSVKEKDKIGEFLSIFISKFKNDEESIITVLKKIKNLKDFNLLNDFFEKTSFFRIGDEREEREKGDIYLDYLESKELLDIKTLGNFIPENAENIFDVESVETNQLYYWGKKGFIKDEDLAKKITKAVPEKIKSHLDNQVKKEILAQGSEKNVHTRELLQNMIDITKKKYLETESGGNFNPKIEIDAFQEIQEDGSICFVDRYRDYGTGIPSLVDLLVAQINNKDGVEDTGFFGSGFLSIFEESDIVQVKTSSEKGYIKYINISVKRDEENKVKGFVIDDYKVSENNEEFQGTETLRKVKNKESKIMDLEYLLLRDSLMKNISSLDVEIGGKKLDIIFNGEKIEKKSKTEFKNKIKVDMQEYSLKIETGGYMQVVSGDGLRMSDLNEKYLELVPEQIYDLISEEKISVVLDKKIPLIKDRSMIAGENEFLPAIQKSIASSMIKLATKRLLEKNRKFKGFPDDYFREYRYGMSYNDQDGKIILEIAKKINEDLELDMEDFEFLSDNYDNESKLARLAVLLEVNIENNKDEVIKISPAMLRIQKMKEAARKKDAEDILKSLEREKAKIDLKDDNETEVDIENLQIDIGNVDTGIDMAMEEKENVNISELNEEEKNIFDKIKKWTDNYGISLGIIRSNYSEGEYSHYLKHLNIEIKQFKNIKKLTEAIVHELAHHKEGSNGTHSKKYTHQVDGLFGKSYKEVVQELLKFIIKE